MGLPYSWVNTWVNTRCANNGKTYTIPIPIPMAATIIGSRALPVGDDAQLGTGQLVLLPTCTYTNSYLIFSYFIFP